MDQEENKVFAVQDLTGDTPFATLTAAEWLQLRERTLQCLQRFLDAAASKEMMRVLMVSMEMSEVVNQMFLEAYALGVDEHLELEPIPKVTSSE